MVKVMGVAPCVIGDKEERMQSKSDHVVDPALISEDTVASLSIISQ